MDTIKNYSLRHNATDIEAERDKLFRKVERREMLAQPLQHVPSRAVAKNNKKASNAVDRSRQPQSMLNMGQPIFYRATVSDERTKKLFAGWRRRINAGKLG